MYIFTQLCSCPSLVPAKAQNCTLHAPVGASLRSLSLALRQAQDQVQPTKDIQVWLANAPKPASPYDDGAIAPDMNTWNENP